MKANQYQKTFCRARVICATFLVVAGVMFSPPSERASAQTTTTPAGDMSQMFDLPALTARGRAMLPKASAASSGSAGEIVATYDGHFMSLNALVKNGGAEFHQNWNDFLFVLDGEGTELTGGNVVEPMIGKDGEIHGSQLAGATPHALHSGEFLYIPAGTPHQLLVAPHNTLVILAIKVRREGAPVLPKP
jgi:hypothetical protein